MKKRLSQYIFEDEFACRCGCGKTRPEGIEKIIPCYDDIQKLLFGVYDLVKARTNALITSGYRCPRHNKKVGGAQYSPHLWGLAIDFIVPIDDIARVIDYLRQFNFLRIGWKKYYDTTKHIHIDVVSKVAEDLYRVKKIPSGVYIAYRDVVEW